MKSKSLDLTRIARSPSEKVARRRVSSFREVSTLTASLCRCNGDAKPYRDADDDLYCFQCGKPVASLYTPAKEPPRRPSDHALEIEGERKAQMRRERHKRWRERHAKQEQAIQAKAKRKRRAKAKAEGRSTRYL